MVATVVNAFNSSKLLIRLGDGGSPETFTHPCMINTSRGIAFSSNPTEVLLPFCPPDDDLSAWIEREPDAYTASISGAGIFDRDSHDIFWDWWVSSESKHVHVLIFEEGYYSGSAILSSYTISGPGRREKVTFDCTILSDGVWTWHASVVTT